MNFKLHRSLGTGGHMFLCLLRVSFKEFVM
jgi:hypothetical protein